MIIRGIRADVPGITFRTWLDDPAVRCASRPRATWPRQWINHKTIADDPEQILSGVGPLGGDLATIAAWRGQVDGAHLVVDYSGRVCQLADLATAETFHATASNAWSVGLEMKERPGGGVYQATLDACVAVTLAGCRALGIQLQMPKLGSYTGHPIPRMSDTGPRPGGPDMVGVFSHRDNTERRGRWDAGEAILHALAAAGVEQFDFAAGEDLDVWAKRQKELGVTADGIPGPGTVAALKVAGYADGIWALGRAT